MESDGGRITRVARRKFAGKSAAMKRSFLKIFPACRYNVSRACRELGVRRSDYSRWTARDAAFRRAVEGFREEILDFFEEELLKRIVKGDGAALVFALRTLARRRGYGDNEKGKKPC